jgi:hypothetical protein
MTWPRSGEYKKQYQLGVQHSMDLEGYLSKFVFKWGHETITQLAKRVGLHPDTVSKLLRQWKADGRLVWKDYQHNGMNKSKFTWKG